MTVKSITLSSAAGASTAELGGPCQTEAVNFNDAAQNLVIDVTTQVNGVQVNGWWGTNSIWLKDYTPLSPTVSIYGGFPNYHLVIGEGGDNQKDYYFTNVTSSTFNVGPGPGGVGTIIKGA